MKLSFKSVAMICGFTIAVFYFFHPVVATAMTAVYLVHRRIMSRAGRVPEMLVKKEYIDNHNWLMEEQHKRFMEYLRKEATHNHF